MRLFFALSCVTLLVTTSAFAQNSKSQLRTRTSLNTIDISDISLTKLKRITTSSNINWWAEFGDTLVVNGSEPKLGALVDQEDLTVLGQWNDLKPDTLSVLIAAHSSDFAPKINVIARSGRMALVTNQTLPVAKHDEDQWRLLAVPFKVNTTYVRAGRFQPKPQIWTKSQSDMARKIMSQVDPVRWYLDVGTLTNWNRHVSSVDIVSARDWIKSEFDELGPTSSRLQKFSVMGRDAWNVIATFDAGPSSDIYIVCGHYDSISERPSETAPGAEDNATGAAGVIELARVFSKIQRSATLIFATFSGEEQGLVGSKAFVRSLDAGIRTRVKAVINMDMIGYSKDDSEDVLLESSNRFKSLVDHLAAAATLVEGLNYYVTYNPYGSDHMPFIESGIPAILTIDNDWGDYPSYHRSTDTIDKVSRDMGAAILRMNAGALGAFLQ